MPHPGAYSRMRSLDTPHDHIINNRDIPLEERLQSCDLLYALSLKVVRRK